MRGENLLSVRDLVKHFPLGGRLFSRPRGWIRAVDGASFGVQKGEAIGLVGESGCGKSTLGQMIVRLIDPTSGSIRFRGNDITRLGRKGLLPYRRKLQIIFQDPYSSLNPRMRVEAIVTEPLRAQGGRSRTQRRKAGAELMERVGLREGDLLKYPHEFSGGERQRIGIARALCVRPELIVADEPVSSLDVSHQAQVINLLADLKEDFDLSYVFISHDISVVQHLCDRVGVMYMGTIVELAPAEKLSSKPLHPYTRALLAAVPQPDPRSRVRPSAMKGDVPSPVDPPAGCAFHPRCPHEFRPCREKRPSLVGAGPERLVACWLTSG